MAEEIKPPERPHPATRLGEVHELEIEGERRDDRLDGTGVQPIELGLDPAAERGIVASSEVDGGSASGHRALPVRHGGYRR